MLKPKEKATSFNNRKLVGTNVKNYLLEKFPGYTQVISMAKKVINMESFLQRNYGVPNDGDCSLTSIMTCIYYYTEGKIKDTVIYDVVRKHAEKLFFSKEIGTNPLLIKTIYDKSLAELKINRKTYSGYLKNIGYNLSVIKNSLHKNNPLIFSMFNDGRNYYKNHSIVILGYETFRLKADDGKIKNVDMLIIYDNWSKNIGYVDYDLVSEISCINY